MKDETKFNKSSTNISLHQYRTELDSHADNFTVGDNVLIVYVHGINVIPKRLNVHAYDPALEYVKDINVANATVAYDGPNTGDVLTLKIKQATHIPPISNNLLCVMQLRLTISMCLKDPIFLLKTPITQTTP